MSHHRVTIFQNKNFLFAIMIATILGKIFGKKLSSKTGQGKNSLISTFASFLTAIAKV